MNHRQAAREISKIADPIDGWLGKREGPYLYRLAVHGAQLGVIVEIGSWQGKSTVWLGKGASFINGGKVFAIDPHVGGPDQEKVGLSNVNTESAFRDNIERAGLESNVIAMVMSSASALEGWSRGIGMLWIDGDHSYEAVSSDFYGWSPFVAENGIIAFHDTYSWEGVRRLVDDEVLTHPGYRVLGQVDGILAIQKRAALDWRDRRKAKTTLLLRRIYNRARVKRSHWRALPRKVLRGMATYSFDKS